MLTQLIFQSSSCLNSMGMTGKKKKKKSSVGQVPVRRLHIIQSCSSTLTLSCVFFHDGSYGICSFILLFPYVDELCRITHLS